MRLARQGLRANPFPRSVMRRIVAISDFCTRVPPEPVNGQAASVDAAPQPMQNVAVGGGYLERLPLACVRAGLADTAEIWSFAGSDGDPTGLTRSPWGLWERRFRADAHGAPYGSATMRAHVAAHGAPDILCVWGLGVTAETLDACAGSLIVYNSLDVDALRIPPEVSARIDLFLTGSEAQSQAVRERHPGALVAVLPIGPEFAAPGTFRPLGTPKDIDVIYVAAAQPYKRHDILFDALDRMPRHIRALCVMGYGEQAGALRQRAADLGLNMEFVGPPGVDYAEVNRLMNRARVGVVCGEADGAPAILTEYMLAGLPVLANARLACGLQYVTAETGRTATAEGFAAALSAILAEADSFDPRAAVLENWAWPQSIARFAALLDEARARRAQAAA